MDREKDSLKSALRLKKTGHSFLGCLFVANVAQAIKWI